MNEDEKLRCEIALKGQEFKEQMYSFLERMADPPKLKTYRLKTAMNELLDQIDFLLDGTGEPE